MSFFKDWRRPALAATIVGAAALSAPPAGATNGYLVHCVGAKNCGMGGAGVALPQDAANGIVNPALMNRVGNEAYISPGWFHPERFKDQTRNPNNAGIVPAAVQVDEDSLMKNFPEGAAGLNYRLTPEWSLGISLVGTGGMHTKYKTPRSVGGQGAGETSVRYRLLHLAPTVSWQPTENASYGASVILGYSDFKSNMGTNNGFRETKGTNRTDRTFGIGFRLGGMWDLNESLSVGVSAASPVWFERFSQYNDLFEGSMDTPANGTIGAVWRPREDTDIAFDVKYIAWGAVFPMANTPRKTQGPGGGFGWESKPVFMLGAQHRLTDDLTLRAGWNYGPSPIPDEMVFANLLFPAVTEHHVNVGASYDLAPNWELSGSFFYALPHSQTDNGEGDFYSVAGEGSEIGMWQMGAQVGLTYTF